MCKDNALSNTHGSAGAAIDWEQGDEEWERAIIGGEVVALVHGTIPLVFLLPDCKFLLEVTPPTIAEIVLSTDFAAKQYSADRIVLRRFASRTLPPIFDHRCFSINDFWWATV